MSDQEKEIEEAFEKYLCEISDNGSKMINRVDLHGLTFRAGYQAAMERVNKEHLCSGCHDIVIENGKCDICNYTGTSKAWE